jgi:hypothetical protein
MDNQEDYNGSQIVIVSVIFLVFTHISVSLRCYTRAFLTDAFSADDWLMIVAQVRTIQTAIVSKYIRGSQVSGEFHTFVCLKSSRSTLWAWAP